MWGWMICERSFQRNLAKFESSLKYWDHINLVFFNKGSGHKQGQTYLIPQYYISWQRQKHQKQKIK